MTRTILLIQSEVAGNPMLRQALSGVGPVVWTSTLSQGLARLQDSLRGLKPAVGAVVCELPHREGMAVFGHLLEQLPRIPALLLNDQRFGNAAPCGPHGDAHREDPNDCVAVPAGADPIGRTIEQDDHAAILFESREMAQVTLEAIADGVITTDAHGLITYCNPVAAELTGWPRDEARGRPFSEVFRLVDLQSRCLQDPMARAMVTDSAVSLSANSMLVRQDGTETAIDDSAAPIHNRTGKVVGAVIVFRDVSVMRIAAAKMSYLAQHDVLTDLPNRLLFTDRLRQAIELAKRQRQMLAVLFLDLDHFKNINDSLGHAVGDRLLQSVAQRLVACVRSADTVSRQGGDEFVILLSDVKRLEDAAVAAEKILEATAMPHYIDDHELHISGSVGIVVYPADGADDTTLLKNADAAMYHAKESGRNNYQFFTPDMNIRAVERLQIESELRLALKSGQFVLHYQPIVDLKHCAIVGVEVLVRWQHPRRGLLHPRSFMAVAEQCGIVVQLGRWVIRETCRQARLWRDAGGPAMRIAVNTSAVELRAKGFVDHIRDCIRETRFTPQNLEIEITETFLLEDSKTTTEVLGAIADMGIRVALDDFGTGYSSLSHLKRYPISTLKIDRSFIAELASDSSDASIVGAVISLGRSLHLHVIAEGVETAEQVELLKAQGCPEAQGYYFSRPVEAQGLLPLLAGPH